MTLVNWLTKTSTVDQKSIVKKCNLVYKAMLIMNLKMKYDGPK